MGNHKPMAVLIAAVILQFTSSVWAEDFDEGKFEFNWACATCHGIDGKGKGPLSSDLSVPPADLTVMAKKNNGAFPLIEVYEVIDGRKSLESHGGRHSATYARIRLPDTKLLCF